MKKNAPLKMTPFDLAVTDNHLLTLKLLLPYAPSEFQSMLGIYVKFSEFQNTISYFHQIQTMNLHSSSHDFNLDSIMDDLKSYYPNEELETLESVVQAMHMMEMMQNLNMDDWTASSNISNLFQTFHQERKDDNNGNMDESSCNE